MRSLQAACAVFCIALGAVSSAQPQPRTYDTHQYYVAELAPRRACGATEEHVAAALGAELVERVGALPHHYLLRREKSDSLARRSVYALDAEANDVVLKRFHALQTPGLSKRCAGGTCVSDACVQQTLRAVDRQVPRQRHKRNVIYDPETMRDVYPELLPPHPVTEAWKGKRDALEVRAPVPINATSKFMDDFQVHDPLFYKQWHLINPVDQGNDLRLDQVWRNATGQGVTVALLDDGLDFHHPDLKDNFSSYDFNDHSELPEPRLSDDLHGTRCAGEIAALPNDFCGVGVAPKARVAGIRILSGPITDADEAASLNFGYETNSIYSCSWGPPDNGQSMDAPRGLIAKALLNGIYNGRDGNGSIFVFAGGNGGGSDDQCNFDGYTNSIYTVTIAAVDHLGKHPYYSEMCSAIIASSYSSGSGQMITTTDVSKGTNRRCTSMHGGTSAAAPLVAGILALALEVRPELTWRDVQHIIVRSAVPSNTEDPDWEQNGAGRKFSHKYGYGVVHAARLLAEAQAHKLVAPQSWFESKNQTVPEPLLKLDEPKVAAVEVSQEMLDQANLKTLEHVTVTVWIEHDRRGDVQVELFSPHGTRSVLASPRRYDSDRNGFPGWTFMSIKHWGEDMRGEWRLQVTDRASKERQNRIPGNFTAFSLSLWGEAQDASKARPWDFPANSEEHNLTLSAAPSSTVLHYSGMPTSTKTFVKPTNALPDDHHTVPGETHEAFGSKVQQPEADTGYLGALARQSTWLAVAAGLAIVAGASLLIYFYTRQRALRRYEHLPTDEGEIQLGALPGEGGMQARDLYDAFALDDESEDEPASPKRSP